MRNLETFYERYKAWSHTTFGMDTPLHGLTKLIKEAEETKANPEDMSEYADCLMCLLYAFSCQFPLLPIDMLINAAFNKLEVNELREWIKQPDGTWQHKKPSTPNL